MSTAALPAWAQVKADAASKRWKGSGEPAGTHPPHVVSAEGDFMAIMAPGRTMRAPSRDAVAEGIQFVARQTLRATAAFVVRRDGTGPVMAALGGTYALNDPAAKAALSPPAPGCYRFVFTWNGLTRSVDLVWQPGPAWSAATLPRQVGDAVTQVAEVAQNKLPGGGYQPPPGKILSPQYQWVRSNRGTVDRAFGALDPLPGDPGTDRRGTATSAEKSLQVVYVVQTTRC